MKKIAVMTDSGADISAEEAKAWDLHVMRLPLIIDDVSYLEAIDISLEDFIARMRKGATVKTSSPILGDLIHTWENLLESYDEVIYVPLSSQLSGSYTTAFAASQAYDGRVIVIDAKFACYPQTVLCRDIQQMIRKGYEGAAIKALVEQQAEMWALLMPENLTALMRGGRISPAVAALGNLLKIVPILKVEHGAIDVYDKVRTHKKAYDIAVKAMCSIDHPELYNFYVVDAGSNGGAEYIAKAMEELLHREVEIHPMHPIIMAHTGPGTAACGWYRKLQY